MAGRAEGSNNNHNNGGYNNHHPNGQESSNSNSYTGSNNNFHGVNNSSAGEVAPKFEQLYEISERILGEGTNAKVHLGYVKETREAVAIKKIEKRPGCFEADLHHVAILGTVDHENIIQLKDYFDTPTHLYLVLELAGGRDIVERITTRGSFSEESAVRYTRQILCALAHCHKRGIVHCDLKPENILFASEDEDSIVKVGDFGFAQVLMGDTKLVERLGTPHYVAPEIITGQGYDTAADMWSLGVITYIILSGHFPFVGGADKKDLRKLFSEITRCHYTFPEQYFGNVSDAAKNFIQSLLELNPSNRASAVQALEHPWITSGGSNRTVPLTESMENLRKLHEARRLHGGVGEVGNALDWRVSHSLSSVIIHTDRQSNPHSAIPLSVPSSHTEDSTLGRRMASLVSLAYEEALDSQLSAALAISNACIDSVCRTSLVRAGCLRALAQLAKSNDVTICNQVGLALFHIVQSPVCATQVVLDETLFQALMKLGSNPSGVVARQAARVLCLLIRTESLRRSVVKAGGLAVTLRLMTSVLTEHQREALQAICSLAENVEFHAAILGSGVLEAINKCVPDNESVGVLFLSAVILQLIVHGGTPGAEEAIIHRAIHALGILAKHPAKVIKGQALKAFMALAWNAREMLLNVQDEIVLDIARQVIAATPKVRASPDNNNNNNNNETSIEAIKEGSMLLTDDNGNNHIETSSSASSTSTAKISQLSPQNIAPGLLVTAKSCEGNNSSNNNNNDDSIEHNDNDNDTVKTKLTAAAQQTLEPPKKRGRPAKTARN